MEKSELLKKVWPQWEIVKELGEGAFGSVYEVQRKDIGGTFKAALKFMSIPKTQKEIEDAITEGMDETTATTYFRSIMEDLVKEFATMEMLKGNTNIVSYEDHVVVEHENEIGWDILIRMELLTPFKDYLQSHTIDEKAVIKIGRDICSALVICEKRNIVHRDIKMENVFVSEYGDFKLGDFGVARTVEKTTSGMSIKGTISYMAPEVYKGQQYNSSVDMYSLGILLYRLANNNRSPFLPPAPAPISYTDKENAEMRRLAGERFPDASMASPELMAIIRKATAFNASDRYKSASDMRDDLAKWAVGKTPSAYEEEKNSAASTATATAAASTVAATAAAATQNVQPVVQQPVQPVAQQPVNVGVQPVQVQPVQVQPQNVAAMQPERSGVYAQPENSGVYAHPEMSGVYAQPQPQAQNVGGYAQPQPQVQNVGVYAQPQPQAQNMGGYSQPENSGVYGRPEMSGVYPQPQPQNGQYVQPAQPAATGNTKKKKPLGLILGLSIGIPVLLILIGLGGCIACVNALDNTVSHNSNNNHDDDDDDDDDIKKPGNTDPVDPDPDPVDPDPDPVDPDPDPVDPDPDPDPVIVDPGTVAPDVEYTASIAFITPGGDVKSAEDNILYMYDASSENYYEVDGNSTDATITEPGWYYCSYYPYEDIPYSNFDTFVIATDIPLSDTLSFDVDWLYINDTLLTGYDYWYYTDDDTLWIVFEYAEDAYTYSVRGTTYPNVKVDDEYIDYIYISFNIYSF